MQVESMVQELRAEIAQLEQDNLELQGQVHTLEATLGMVRKTLQLVVENLNV